MDVTGARQADGSAMGYSRIAMICIKRVILQDAAGFHCPEQADVIATGSS